jgi:hypothetical protein
MAILKNSQFTEYELTDEEEYSGSILTDTQKQVIQNDRVDVATQLINLEFTSQDPLIFAQQRARLQGQLWQLNYILERSDQAEQMLAQQVQQLREEGN